MAHIRRQIRHVIPRPPMWTMWRYARPVALALLLSASIVIITTADSVAANTPRTIGLATVAIAVTPACVACLIIPKGRRLRVSAINYLALIFSLTALLSALLLAYWLPYLLFLQEFFLCACWRGSRGNLPLVLFAWSWRRTWIESSPRVSSH